MPKVICRVLGVLFVLFGLYTAVVGGANCARQLGRESWELRGATATAVTERRESRGLRHSRHVTVYDVTYEYFIYGETHTGRMTGTLQPVTAGDVFDVRVDPEAPENSTHILSVQWDSLAANLVGTAVFCCVGLWLLDLRPAFLRRCGQKVNF